MSSHTSLTEWEVLNMLELGVEHGVIIERLVETGDWSTSGANDRPVYDPRPRPADERPRAAPTAQAGTRPEGRRIP